MLNLSMEETFLRAVYFANNRQEYLAYTMFRSLSRMPGSNPAVWLWLAKLSPDYGEGENALLKIAELGPEDYHLSKARAHFEQRWRWRKFWSNAGLVVALALLPFLLFTIYNIFILPRLFSKGMTVFYSRPFVDNKVSLVILILFPILILTGTFLYCTMKARQRVTSWNFFNFKFLWCVLGLLLFFGYLLFPQFTLVYEGYTYLGKTTSATTRQVYYLEAETNFRQMFQTTVDFKVYKCDSSGLFCQQFKKITTSPHVGPKPVQLPLERNNYRLQVNDSKRELYIMFDGYYTNVKNAVWETIKLG